MDRWNRRKFLGVTTGSLMGLATVGCSRGASKSVPEPETGPSGVKVLIVGMDGATFDIVLPMAQRGELPHMTRMMDTGAAAGLLSVQPMLSPVLWTTIATGRHRADHGVKGFLRQRADGTLTLVCSEDRLKPALWNIASAYGKSTSVVGWWVTWPAEKINGLMVSDRVVHSRWGIWTEARSDGRQVSPQSMLARVQDRIVSPSAPPMDEIRALADWTEGELEEMLQASEPVLAHGPSVFKFGYCAQRSFEQIALDVLADGQPDLTQVFLIAIDPTCHTFWHFFQPEAFPEEVDADAVARLGKLIPNMYAHNDAVLGELLGRVGEDTVVLVVSDHGFQATGVLPGQTRRVTYEGLHMDRVDEFDRPVTVGQSGCHDLTGVFLASGGPIVRDVQWTAQPTLVDIAPTVLALLGLPVGRDMPGRVITEIIDPAFLEAHPIQYVDTHDALADQPLQSEIEKQAGEASQLEYLRSLGYIE